MTDAQWQHRPQASLSFARLTHNVKLIANAKKVPLSLNIKILTLCMAIANAYKTVANFSTRATSLASFFDLRHFSCSHEWLPYPKVTWISNILQSVSMPKHVPLETEDKIQCQVSLQRDNTNTCIYSDKLQHEGLNVLLSNNTNDNCTRQQWQCRGHMVWGWKLHEAIEIVDSLVLDRGPWKGFHLAHSQSYSIWSPRSE